MAIIMAKGCLEAIYGLMGWKGLMLNWNYNRCFRIYRVVGRASFLKDMIRITPFYRFQFDYSLFWTPSLVRTKLKVRNADLLERVKPN